MIPKPPICDQHGDQHLAEGRTSRSAVSTTASPVTQTAEVAVNSAVTNGAWPGSARAAGSIISSGADRDRAEERDGHDAGGIAPRRAIPHAVPPVVDPIADRWSYHLGVTFTRRTDPARLPRRWPAR